MSHPPSSRSIFWILGLVSLVTVGAAPASEPRSSVTDEPVSRIQVAARKIDRLIEDNLDKNRMGPNNMASDEVFVRRAFLCVVGRIPTLEETDAFLDSTNPEKHRVLLDWLLDSPGYSSHAFNYWADILRARSKAQKNISGEPYLHWIKESVSNNVSYDQFVTDLITADGSAHARDNGATGYYLRDREMPEDNMANTARVFLGTRLECAQCHNHPFDKWTQKDFFRMVAFTGDLTYRDEDLEASGAADRVDTVMEWVVDQNGRQGRNAFRKVLRPVVAGLTGMGSGLVQLPKDYQYDDGHPGDWIVADPLFGEIADLEVNVPEPKKRKKKSNRARGRKKTGILPDINSRSAYAEWMTSPQNPRFTTVIANRMWKRVMGRGLIEPVDNLTDDSVSTNPELLVYLEEVMIDFDYDLKQFQRILLNTRMFRRQSMTEDLSLENPKPLTGPLMRRMTAEQVWDSLLTLAISDIDDQLAESGAFAEPVYRKHEEFLNFSEQELLALAEREILSYVDKSAYQDLRDQEKAERKGEAKSVRKIGKSLARARNAGDAKAEQDILETMGQMGFDSDRARARKRRSGNPMVRASDLMSPAPPEHFLAKFGQSDREQIEASHTDANVPQVLALLNGFVETHILGKSGSVLLDSVKEAGKPKKTIRVAYRTILGRDPAPEEITLWKSDLADNGREAKKDLVWSLLNMHEFLFIQ